MELLAGRAHAKGLELACRIHDDVPEMMHGDALRLRQILINLVSNAIKFTQRGEVVVEIRRDGAIDGGCFGLRCAVRDTGIGITAKGRQRLFKAFSQADGSTTRKFGGTGLGLAISRQLAQMMGGEIGVDSEPAQGSTFWFTVRLTAVAQGVKTEGEHAALVGVRALIVEDNPTNREILQHQLSNWGLNINTAADGIEALETLRSAVASGQPYHLALVDMKMPRMKAWSWRARSKPMLLSPVLRMIMLTSIAGSQEASAARAAGIVACLSKPVRQSDLYRTIAAAAGVAGGKPVMPAGGEMPARLQGRVLLVEDNPVNQELAGAILSMFGCQTTTAGNGHDAIAAYAVAATT